MEPFLDVRRLASTLARRAAIVASALLTTACGTPLGSLTVDLSIAPCDGLDAACAALPDPECAANPAPRTTVVLSGPIERLGATGDDGRVILEDLPPGRYAVTVALVDSVEGRLTEIVEVPEGPLALAMRFTAAGEIEGEVRIVDADGRPLDIDRRGIEVKLDCPPRAAAADAEGRFRLRGVPVGARRLTAVGPLIVTPEPVDLEVEAGRVQRAELVLAPGRPPDSPGNRPPTLDSTISVTLLPPAVGELLPATQGLLRGQRARLGCSASDPDADALQYLWTASSGTLEGAGNAAATLTAGGEDVGISCSVLDGRGGLDVTHTIIPVADPYFAGAALRPDGAVLAASIGGNFDLTFIGAAGGTGWPQPGDQWLPSVAGSTLAYIDRQAGPAVLRGASLPPSGPPTASSLVDSNAAAHLAVPGGVVFIDRSGNLYLWHTDGTRLALGSNYGDGRLSRTALGFAAGRTSTVDVFELSAGNATFVRQLDTLGRNGGRFATDGTRIVYWSSGRPVLYAGGISRDLGPEQARGSGRVALAGDHAAYSYYGSPVDFVEATVVKLGPGGVVSRARAAIGPADVLDLDDSRLLLGRSRSTESEPSKDVYWVDVEGLLEGGP